MRTATDFSIETLKAKKAYNDVFQALKEKKTANVNYCTQQSYPPQVKGK
jgi:hypothetical protein